MGPVRTSVPAPALVSAEPLIVPFEVSTALALDTDSKPPPAPSEILRFVDASGPVYSSLAPPAIEKFPVPNAEFDPWWRSNCR